MEPTADQPTTLRHGNPLQMWITVFRADTHVAFEEWVQGINEKIRDLTYDDDVLTLGIGAPVNEVLPDGRVYWSCTITYRMSCPACMAEGKGPRHALDTLVDSDGAADLRRLWGEAAEPDDDDAEDPPF